MPNYRRADIPDLAKAIMLSGREGDGEPKSGYIFWLGAGVSRTAGIPLAEGMVYRLLDRLWRMSQPETAAGRPPEPLTRLSDSAAEVRRSQVRQWAVEQHIGGADINTTDWGSLYTTCLALLPGELNRQEFIVECVEEGRGRLNLAHLFMAQLMASEVVKIVLTTNFDDLLLRALQLYFKFPAAIDSSSIETLMIRFRFLQIAYLHGKLNSYRQRHTTEEINQQIPGLEAFLAKAMQDHGLVVVGYRGGEEMPMEMLGKILRERNCGPGRGLYWVSYGKDDHALAPRVRSLLEFKDTYWMPGWDADDFFEKLCNFPGIGLALPTFLKDPKVFAKRMQEILPESVVGPWRSLPDTEPTEVKPGPTDQPTEERDQHLAEEPPPRGEAERLLPEARELLMSGKTEEAISVCDRAIAIAPDSPNVYLTKGLALSALGREAEATEQYRRATEVDPHFAPAFRAWGDALRALGRYEEAIEQYRRATEVDPADPWAYDRWGDALRALGRHEEAIEQYRRATEVDPTYTWAYYGWGLALRALGRHEEAIGQFRRATEVDSQSAPAFKGWGDALRALGRHEEAIEQYRRDRKSTRLNSSHLA